MGTVPDYHHQIGSLYTYVGAILLIVTLQGWQNPDLFTLASRDTLHRLIHSYVVVECSYVCISYDLMQYNGF